MWVGFAIKSDVVVTALIAVKGEMKLEITKLKISSVK